MIYRKKNFRALGKIVRAHGVKGAVALRLEEGMNNDVLEGEEWCFLMIRNKPVPFRILDAAAMSDNEVILELEGFETKESVENILGLQLSIQSKRPVLRSQSVIDDLAGYQIFDEGKSIGRIDHIEDTGMQLLFAIEDDILIPAHDDLIESIDDENKIVYMNLPEGLLE
jgi:16S rRNA processing protein RimM